MLLKEIERENTESKGESKPFCLMTITSRRLSFDISTANVYLKIKRGRILIIDE